MNRVGEISLFRDILFCDGNDILNPKTGQFKMSFFNLSFKRRTMSPDFISMSVHQYTLLALCQEWRNHEKLFQI